MKQGGWVVMSGAREAWRRFRESWHDLPRGAFRRWLTVMVIGWALGAGLAAGLSLLGKRLAASGMAEWDRQALLEVAANERFSFQTAIFFEGLGSSAVLIPLTLLAMAMAAWARRAMTALTLGAAYLLHDPLVWIGWSVWDRARPDLVAGGIASPPLHSYPSGHAVQMIAVYGLLVYLWLRRSGALGERLLGVALVAALTAVVCYARVRLGVHWPSDIGAGIVIGLFWLLVCVLALQRSERAAPLPPP